MGAGVGQVRELVPGQMPKLRGWLKRLRGIGVYRGMRMGFEGRGRWVAVALLTLPVVVAAQTAPTGETPSAGTISVESRLVNIPVVVRDGKGALVNTLSKADFSLMVDGKAQTIRYFDLDRDLPLTLGLLVDTSGSVRDELDAERTASTAFLDSMLTGKEDKAFVIQFARTVELLQDTTGSRPKLQKALQELDTTAPDHGGPGGNGGGSQDPQDSQDPQGPQDSGGGQQGPNGGNSGNGGRGGRGRNFGGAGTTLYDAVFLAADELMSKQKGRKALVLLTDGEDRGSKERLADAIEKAQRSDTIVYAIYFKGEQPKQGGGPGGGGRRGGISFPGGGGGYPGGGGGYPGGGGGQGRGGGGQQQVDGKKVLERMTGETGGRMFELTKKETFGAIFDEIAKELRSQYRLGYTPDSDAAEAGYHKIDLAFTSKDKSKFTIQTRDGYYTGK
jgi:VWFA-related protein